MAEKKAHINVKIENKYEKIVKTLTAKIDEFDKKLNAVG